MAYVKQEWKNSPNHTTPVNATRMNHIEDGIVESNVLRNLWGNGNLYAQRDTSRKLTIPLDAGTYTFSWGKLTKTSTENPLFAFYNSSDKTIGYIYLSGTSQTLILTDKAVSFRFYPAQTYDSSASQTANLKDIQLEKGSEKTSYTPYLGYITESGSNSNGNWIKYSDGTMICSGKKELSSVAITNSINNGALFASELLTSFADFPAIFIDKPTSFSMSVSSSGGYGAWIQKMYPPSATNINNFRIIGTWNSTQNFEVSYIAIGKWK